MHLITNPACHVHILDWVLATSASYQKSAITPHSLHTKLQNLHINAEFYSLQVHQISLRSVASFIPYTYNFGAWESSQGTITDHWSSFGQGHVCSILDNL